MHPGSCDLSATRRERWLGLGPVHTVGLKQARERAKAARLQLLDGIDPIDTKKANKATVVLEAARSLTFEKAARQYFDQVAGGWKNAKHRAQFLSTMQRYAFPVIGKLSVADIETLTRRESRKQGARGLPRAAPLGCYSGNNVTTSWTH